jgi:DNA-binding transcriptional LysR family regulator
LQTGLFKKTIQISERDEIRLVLRLRKEGRSDAENELQGCATNGAKFKTLMHCDSADSVKEIVRHGAGVGILYHDTVKREIEQGEFKVVRIPGLDAARQSYIVYSKERPLSSHAREFLALLRASVPTDSRVKVMASRISNGSRRPKMPNHVLSPLDT